MSVVTPTATQFEPTALLTGAGRQLGRIAGLLLVAALTFTIATPVAGAFAPITETQHTKAAWASQAKAAAKFARDKLVNKKYGSAATVSQFNCSGSTYLAWNAALPGAVQRGRASSQYDGNGVKIKIGRGNTVDTRKLREGDLLFWSKSGKKADIYHVAIYLGKGKILQTHSSRKSWVGGVNDDRASRMTYALRPGPPPPNKRPEGKYLVARVEGNRIVTSGKVWDPNSPRVSLTVRVKTSWVDEQGTTRRMEVLGTAYRDRDGWGRGSFDLRFYVPAASSYTVTLAAIDAQNGKWYNVKVWTVTGSPVP
jgi:hypothetical protein